MMTTAEMRDWLYDQVTGNDFDSREERHRIMFYMSEHEIRREYECETNIDNSRRREDYSILRESFQSEEPKESKYCKAY